MEKYEEMVEGAEAYDDEGASSSEKAFMQGYLDEDDGTECVECGSAIQEEGHKKEIDGEMHKFCSKSCLEEFEESL